MRFAKLMVGGSLIIGALVAPASVAVAQDTGPLYMECLLNPPAELVGRVGGGGLTVRGANFEAPFNQVRLDLEGQFVGNFVGPVFTTTIPLPADARGSFTATATAYGTRAQDRTCRATTTVTITTPVCEKDCLPATGASSLPLTGLGLAGIAVGAAFVFGARIRMTTGREAEQLAPAMAFDALMFDPPMPPRVSPFVPRRIPPVLPMPPTPRVPPPGPTLERGAVEEERRPSKRHRRRLLRVPARRPTRKPSLRARPRPSSGPIGDRVHSFLSELKSYAE
jgi:hypothetical protein